MYDFRQSFQFFLENINLTRSEKVLYTLIFTGFINLTFKIIFFFKMRVQSFQNEHN
jgi:cell division protein FtsL